MRTCLAALAAVLSFSSCTGIAVGPDFGPSSQAVHNLGARIVRVEFDIGSSCSSMEPALTAYANAGARPLLLAGFDGRIPSTGEAQSLAVWAQCFGPGSTWGAAHGDARVDTIEFGNETSYCGQFSECSNPGWYSTAAYSQRAADYGNRAHAAKAALNFAGNGVKLLVQADDGGSGSANWVNGLVASSLTSSDVGGWTVHPYGSNPTAKLGRLVGQTSSFSSSIPVDVTEYGIGSTEGAGGPCVLNSDNLGWGNQLSYSQAASDLHTGLGAIRSYLGGRLGFSIVFKAKDDRTSCADNDIEHFYGAVKQDLSAKGDYTAAVRDELTR